LDIFTQRWTNLNPIDDFEHDRSRLFISQRTGCDSSTRPARAA